MDVNAAIDHEARAQAACMRHEDFERAYRAFVEKRPPEFEGH
jgi:enoyl-CoA hydratase/carnithine racemase